MASPFSWWIFALWLSKWSARFGGYWLGTVQNGDKWRYAEDIEVMVEIELMGGG